MPEEPRGKNMRMYVGMFMACLMLMPVPALAQSPMPCSDTVAKKGLSDPYTSKMLEPVTHEARKYFADLKAGKQPVMGANFGEVLADILKSYNAKQNTTYVITDVTVHDARAILLPGYGGPERGIYQIEVQFLVPCKK